MSVDTTSLVTAVDRAVGVNASAEAFIRGIAAQIQAAVDAALAADDAADQGSIDAANAAIASEVTKLTGATDKLAAALVSNPS